MADPLPLSANIINGLPTCTEIGKKAGCLLSYSQAEPGRELTQPSPRLLAEPCNSDNYLAMAHLAFYNMSNYGDFGPLPLCSHINATPLTEL